MEWYHKVLFAGFALLWWWGIMSQANFIPHTCWAHQMIQKDVNPCGGYGVEPGMLFVGAIAPDDVLCVRPAKTWRFWTR